MVTPAAAVATAARGGGEEQDPSHTKSRQRPSLPGFEEVAKAASRAGPPRRRSSNQLDAYALSSPASHMSGSSASTLGKGKELEEHWQEQTELEDEREPVTFPSIARSRHAAPLQWSQTELTGARSYTNAELHQLAGLSLANPTQGPSSFFPPPFQRPFDPNVGQTPSPTYEFPPQLHPTSSWKRKAEAEELESSRPLKHAHYDHRQHPPRLPSPEPSSFFSTPVSVARSREPGFAHLLNDDNATAGPLFTYTFPTPASLPPTSSIEPMIAKSTKRQRRRQQPSIPLSDDLAAAGSSTTRSAVATSSVRLHSNNVVHCLFEHHRIPASLPEGSLLVIWDGRRGRAIDATSDDATHLAEHEANEALLFPPGTWKKVRNEIDEEVWPWSSGKAGNDWLRYQADFCVCSRFKFTQGKDQKRKHPSVLRDHIAYCKSREENDPLKRLCALERQVEKTVKSLRNAVTPALQQVVATTSPTTGHRVAPSLPSGVTPTNSIGQLSTFNSRRSSSTFASQTSHSSGDFVRNELWSEEGSSPSTSRSRSPLFSQQGYGVRLQEPEEKADLHTLPPQYPASTPTSSRPYGFHSAPPLPAFSYPSPPELQGYYYPSPAPPARLLPSASRFDTQPRAGGMVAMAQTTESMRVTSATSSFINKHSTSTFSSSSSGVHWPQADHDTEMADN